ncbi:PTS system IIB component (Glc family) /PTS system IIC component (Glc family) [Melghirimyces profundicolus]|uniref:PTS system IIB component (Glc family) /PTS system IIC component (Glc family) n=1 Tax=Melghirimyces profundicolus TaxID=1242148 RepID=A0A2T6C2A6_9BACL|nr:PTS transporter subunit EIIC [Melghirimyces profundicolus]PTX62450.1 PTS system IIB component (Glc family) /PTS system IIC component (Glc family) [Melghirimyces profundicolus]
MEKEKVLADSIVELLGGEENIKSLNHCMTRLRVTPREREYVQLKELKAQSGVMGVVDSSDQLQIILGPGTVTKVARIISERTGIQAGEVEDMKAAVQDKNRTPFKLFLRKLASIFIPLIPAIVAGGMIMGLTNVAIHSFDVSEKNQWIVLLSSVSKIIFAYLAIFVGINTAREFGGTPALGGVAGGLIIFPDIANITLFGEALVPNRGGLIGVLLAAWFITVMERWFRKVIPNTVDIIFTPTLAVLATGFATYIILQPVGGVISDSITGGLTWLLSAGESGWMSIVSGAVLAGTFLPLVMTGLHQGLTPIHMELLNQTGLDPLYPILGMAGAGQVGAALAVYVKSKNQTLRNVIKGGLPVGILGIGEPLIYGVTLPLGRPFITACLGAAVGGAFQAVLGVASVAIGVSGLPMALLIQPGQILLYLLGVVISYGAGFVITYFFGFNKGMDTHYGDEAPAGPGLNVAP